MWRPAILCAFLIAGLAGSDAGPGFSTASAHDCQDKIGLKDWNPALGKAIQARLKARGYYRGPIDGKLGPKSRAAMDAFRTERGMVADHRLHADFMKELLGVEMELDDWQDQFALLAELGIPREASPTPNPCQDLYSGRDPEPTN